MHNTLDYGQKRLRDALYDAAEREGYTPSVARLFSDDELDVIFEQLCAGDSVMFDASGMTLIVYMCHGQIEVENLGPVLGLVA